MAGKTTAKKGTSATAAKASTGFTAGERAAMKELLKERRAAATKEEGEKAVLAAIAKMPTSDRTMAKRIHAIVTETAPQLSAKTWYGMPAYADGDGKVVCFFRDAAKFKTRYATLGFEDAAKLDDGNMWPVAFALKDLSTADESRIRTLVKKAVG